MIFTKIRYSFYREHYGQYKELFIGFTIDMNDKIISLNYISNDNSEIYCEKKFNDEQYNILVSLLEYDKLSKEFSNPMSEMHYFVNDILNECFQLYDNKGHALELLSRSDYPRYTITELQIIRYIISTFAPDYKYSKEHF